MNCLRLRRTSQSAKRPSRGRRLRLAGTVAVGLTLALAVFAAGYLAIWEPWYIPNLLARESQATVENRVPGPPFAARNSPPAKDAPDAGGAAVATAAVRPGRTRSGASYASVLDWGRDAVNSEEEWLRASVAPGGAIYQNPERQLIIPYFANLSALALASSNPTGVASYIDWYLGHVNRGRDRWGLAGTIYDFQVVDGVTEAMDYYDSADSYAATFLSAVAAYYRTTGDKDFVRARMADIELVASVILNLQQGDGLCWAKPLHLRKYLMDNSEVYRGLKDWAGVLASLGRADRAAGYEDAARRVREGILGKLWDGASQSFIWALDHRGGKRMVNWGKWYPDVISQVFPIVTGVLAPDDPRAIAIYERVNSLFPNWPTAYRTETLPWAVMGYTAYVIGDTAMAMEILEASHNMNREGARPASWHSLESAFLILTYRGLAGNLPFKMLAE
jgi:hypothetical protein